MGERIYLNPDERKDFKPKELVVLWSQDTCKVDKPSDTIDDTVFMPKMIINDELYRKNLEASKYTLLYSEDEGSDRICYVSVNNRKYTEISLTATIGDMKISFSYHILIGVFKNWQKNKAFVYFKDQSGIVFQMEFSLDNIRLTEQH